MIYLFKKDENYFIKNDENDETIQLIKDGRNKRENDEKIDDEDKLYDWEIPQFNGHNTQKSMNKYKLKNYLLNNDKLILDEKDKKSSNEKTQKYSKKSSKMIKYNFIDYMTEEEKIWFENIKNECIKRHDKRINNPDRIKILSKIDELLKLKKSNKIKDENGNEIIDDEEIEEMIDLKLEKLNKKLEEIDKI